jgi:phosphate transport system permease protein
LQFQSSVGGGGIRGSLLTTLLLIALTLVIALPIGIISAIYLHEYAPQNKFTDIIRSLIDMTNGIPSIIFGFVGAIVFIPMMNGIIGSQGGSIASGALTLTIILLPTIIKTTEESLKTIPLSYRQASLALGASQTQTVFKVVLPNAIGGLLTATLLSIGRIIGESAALIYAVGTVIKDTVAINERSTSLAVHIWSIMAGENPNFELASSIAILILVVVFILNITVKLISSRADKTKVRVLKEITINKSSNK